MKNQTGLEKSNNKYGFLSLAIPFYNEEENAEDCIKERIKEFDKAGFKYELIGVNNGSWDKTGEILERLKSSKVRIVTVKKNKGFGFGIKQGLKIAKGDYLGYDAGDNEVKADACVKIFKKLVDQDLDLCKGYRISRGYNFWRRFESKMYNILSFIILGYRLGDINGYPKIMTRQCYNAIKAEHNDGFFDAEMLAIATRKGFKINHVEVHFLKRPKGKSKMNLRVPMENFRAMLAFRLKSAFGRIK